MSAFDDNLLLRWSRRKHEARQAKPVEPAEPASNKPAFVEHSATTAATVDPAAPNTPASPKADNEAPIKREDLPDIETLTYESDFSVFMREGVPEFLRRQALRKLWLSDPILANLDGLNDYDPKSMTFLIQDVEGAVEGVAEVGRGLRDKIMEAKRARDDRPRGHRGARRQRPPHTRPGAPKPARTDVVEATSASDSTQVSSDDATPADPKRYDS
jgi:Protein of unknown function (DUF3306)